MNQRGTRADQNAPESGHQLAGTHHDRPRTRFFGFYPASYFLHFPTRSSLLFALAPLSLHSGLGVQLYHAISPHRQSTEVRPMRPIGSGALPPRLALIVRLVFEATRADTDAVPGSSCKVDVRSKRRSRVQPFMNSAEIPRHRRYVHTDATPESATQRAGERGRARDNA